MSFSSCFSQGQFWSITNEHDYAFPVVLSAEVVLLVNVIWRNVFLHIMVLFLPSYRLKSPVIKTHDGRLRFKRIKCGHIASCLWCFDELRPFNSLDTPIFWQWIPEIQNNSSNNNKNCTNSIRPEKNNRFFPWWDLVLGRTHSLPWYRENCFSVFFLKKLFKI